MKFRIPFEIAVRYARSRKDTGYLSFISKVSLVGMSLGVIVLTVIVSVMNGFDTELKHRILGAVPHVVLVDQGAHLDRDVLMSNPDVAYVARFQQRQGMVVGRNASKLITIYGVDAVSEPSVSVISSHMVDGEMTVLTPGSNAVVIGQTLGYQLGLRVGDELAIVLPKPNASGHSVKPVLAKVTVEGFFELESELDYSLRTYKVYPAIIERASGLNYMIFLLQTPMFLRFWNNMVSRSRHPVGPNSMVIFSKQ